MVLAGLSESRRSSVSAMHHFTAWSAWVVRSSSFQPEMLLYLCPFAGRWYFCLRSAVPLRNLSCSLGLSCTHTSTHPSVRNLDPQHWSETSFVLHNVNREFVNPLNSPVEPVRVSFVTPVVLCDSQITQSHQGPLDSSHVLAWRHATVLHEQSTHQIQGGGRDLCSAVFATEYSLMSTLTLL